MKLKEISVIKIVLLILIIVQGCSSNLEVISKWTDQPITIDGKDDDWQNKTLYVKEENFLIGIQNDNEYLYLALISADRNVQSQIMSRGLTIWFDREGKENKKFGVKFPLGFMESGMMPMKQNVEENPDALNQMFGKEQSELEILIPDNEEKIKMNLSQASGITTKISLTDGRMIYEMKIALVPGNKNHYGIGVKDFKSKIGVGFETSEIDRDEIKQKMISGNMDGVDKEKVRDNMGGRRGGGMRGDRIGGSIPEPIKYWVSVFLSSE